MCICAEGVHSVHCACEMVKITIIIIFLCLRAKRVFFIYTIVPRVGDKLISRVGNIN